MIATMTMIGTNFSTISSSSSSSPPPSREKVVKRCGASNDTFSRGSFVKKKETKEEEFC
jgi:hypothetical protein